MKRFLLSAVVVASCIGMMTSAAMAASIPSLYWIFGEESTADLSGDPFITGSNYSALDEMYPVTPGLSTVASAIPSNGYALYEGAVGDSYGGVYVGDYRNTPLDETNTVSIFLRMNPGVADSDGDGIDDVFAIRNRDSDGQDAEGNVFHDTDIRYGFESQNGVLNFQLLGAGAETPTAISLSNPLTPGTWYDVVGTFNNGVANFYVQESVSGTVVENITQTMSFTSLDILQTEPDGTYPGNGNGAEAAEVTLLHTPWYEYGHYEGCQVDQVAVWNEVVTPSDILTNGISLPEPPPEPELPEVTPTAYWVFGAEAGDDCATADGNATDLYWIAGINPNTEMAVNAPRSNNRGLYEGANEGDPAGWAYAGVISDGELDITGAVSVFARIKAEGFDGTDDIVRSNIPGGGGVRADQYGLGFVDGIPQFVVTEAGNYTGTVAINLGEEIGGTAISVDTWYDITGVFEPTASGGTLSISVYESETGVLVGTSSKDVYFSSLISNEFHEDANVEFHVFETPQNANGTNPGFSLEELGVWDIALTPEQIAKLSEMTAKVPGDANSDGKVDGSDVTILAGNWQVGVGGVGGATWDMGDFNGDGAVDGSDVTILAGNWQYGVDTAAASVPEPAATALLFGMLSMLLLWKRR